MLRGLEPEYIYEITEPIPNNLTLLSSNNVVVESEESVYQLGYNSVVLTGEILMNAGNNQFYLTNHIRFTDYTVCIFIS
jgi:hypothetical protein